MKGFILLPEGAQVELGQLDWFCDLEDILQPVVAWHSHSLPTLPYYNLRVYNNET